MNELNSSPHPLLQVDHLTVRFGPSTVVDDISFSIAPGEKFGLVGESGSGKSITALSVLRLVDAATTAGAIRFDGADLTAKSEREMRGIRGADIAMIFQEPMTALNPLYTVGNQIGEVLELHEALRPNAARARAIELLKRTGIPEPERRIDAYPHQLSGGQRQRAMIAMALACQPRLLICDEPTTALDVTIQAQILELLRKLQKDLHMSVILITHDLGVVAEYTEHVLVMYAGRVVESAAVGDLFAHPRHPYTRGLLESLPRPREAGTAAPRRLKTIEGMVPDLRRLPRGCRFADRCPMVIARCTEVEPELRDLGGRLSRCHRAEEV